MTYKIYETPTTKYPTMVTVVFKNNRRRFISRENAQHWIYQFETESKIQAYIKRGSQNVPTELASIGIYNENYTI